jgi:hypothetical protein
MYLLTSSLDTRRGGGTEDGSLFLALAFVKLTGLYECDLRLHVLDVRQSTICSEVSLSSWELWCLGM